MFIKNSNEKDKISTLKSNIVDYEDFDSKNESENGGIILKMKHTSHIKLNNIDFYFDGILFKKDNEISLFSTASEYIMVFYSKFKIKDLIDVEFTKESIQK